MKKRIWIILILLIGIILLGFYYVSNLIESKNQDLKRAEFEIEKLWDEKIAGYQFMVNVT